MATLQLSFGGSYPFDLVREALGDALTALGDPCAPWVEIEHRTLEDRNHAAIAFEGRWERGEATLTMAARHEGASGNPRDGYGYITTVALESPRLTLVVHGASLDGLVRGLRVPLPLVPEVFRLVRAALGGRLDRDESDHGWTAIANVAALEGVDRALQVELLQAALAKGNRADRAWVELMKWKEKILGGSLRERLRECPADLGAWTSALTSPPDGFTSEGIMAACARLEVWDPSRPRHRLSDAWLWLPALGGDGRAPTGWFQLDDGANPIWERPALANQVAHALFGFAPGKGEVPLGGRPLDDRVGGRAIGRATWGDGELPRVHVSWTTHGTHRFEVLASVDWIWGDGMDDCVVLASRRKPPSPVAMFLSGTDIFRVTVLRALHAIEPFAWRRTTRPMERPFAQARVPSKGRREEVLALFERLEDVDEAVKASFEACRCGAGDDVGCPHERVIVEATRLIERRLFCERNDARAHMRLRAMEAAYRAAQLVRFQPQLARVMLDEGWRFLSMARAVTDVPSLE